MALVNCPECGRANVSDSAVSCPDCGFGIKSYFTELENERIRQAEEIKRIQEEQAKNKREQERLESIERPTKPRLNILFYVFGFIGIFTLISCIYFTFNFGTGALAIVSLIGIIVLWNKYYEEDKKYTLAEMDFDEYRQRIIASEDKLTEIREAFHREQEELKKQNDEIKKKRSCPICGNMNTKRISTSSRVISTGMVGLASSTIGKQYKCTKCGHMW